MSKAPEEMSLHDLIRELWPNLDVRDREEIAQAEQKLGTIDTWSEGPAGRTETNYHGEAYEYLKVLSHKLRQAHPNDPFVAELHARYGDGKKTSW
jgi:hypothetical protein